MNTREAARAGSARSDGPLLPGDILDRASRGLVRKARWYAQKSLPLRRLQVEATIPVGERDSGASLAVLRADVGDGRIHLYSVPTSAALAASEPSIGPSPGWLKARSGRRATVGEATDCRVARELLALIVAGGERVGRQGRLRGEHFTPGVAGIAGRAEDRFRSLGVEQSHTSLLVDRAAVLKIYRELSRGDNPDVSVPRHLVRGPARVLVPLPLGQVVLERTGAPPSSVASLTRFVPNRGNAFQWFVGQLSRGSPDHPALARVITTLAQDIADLHRALARSRGDPAFAPVAVTQVDTRRWQGELQDALEELLTLLARRRWNGLAAPLVRRVQANAEQLRRVPSTINQALTARLVKIRVHGDLHLGQILITARRSVVLDFEGEPARPVASRQTKRLVLKDVGGMLRSFDYAAYAAVRASDRPGIAGAEAQAWSRRARTQFLVNYRRRLASTASLVRLLPQDPGEAESLARFFELEKAIYEARYELDHRPDWAPIPLSALVELARVKE
jgi:trehalose synthase-fused probable maltokinase